MSAAFCAHIAAVPAHATTLPQYASGHASPKSCAAAFGSHREKLVYRRDRPASVTPMGKRTGNPEFTPEEKLRRLVERFELQAGSFPHQILTSFLSGKHIRQTDRRLAQRGLLPADGGLCGPTCVSNILTSIQLTFQGDSRELISNAPAFIEEFVRVATNIKTSARTDARYGTNENDLTGTIQKMKDEETLENRISVRALPARERNRQLADLSPAKDEAAFIGMTTSRDEHWMILLAINPERSEALLLDPNDNLDPHVVPARVDDGVLYLFHGHYGSGKAQFASSWSRVTAYLPVTQNHLHFLTPEMHERYRR